MKAAVWDGSDILKFDPDYPDPVCRDDWVVIKVMSAGICATDLHIMRGEFGEPPLIMGHEICGIITEIGSRVESCGVGDRVVVETAVSCGHCRYCESGQKHLCSECHEVGFPPHNGGYAQYVTAPANCIHRIPDSMSWDEGGVLEAALCPFGLICRYGVKPGETDTGYGCGRTVVSAVGKGTRRGQGHRRREESIPSGAGAQIRCGYGDQYKDGKPVRPGHGGDGRSWC